MSEIGESILRGLREALARERGEAVDVRIRTVAAPVSIDVKAIRQRLGLSQREFAGRFGFPLGAVQTWERGRRHPEGAARVLLTVIDREPEAVDRALSE